MVMLHFVTISTWIYVVLSMLACGVVGAVMAATSKMIDQWHADQKKEREQWFAQVAKRQDRWFECLRELNDRWYESVKTLQTKHLDHLTEVHSRTNDMWRAAVRDALGGDGFRREDLS